MKRKCWRVDKKDMPAAMSQKNPDQNLEKKCERQRLPAPTKLTPVSDSFF